MQAISEDIGIYVHVPFCAKNCAFCRFYKRLPTPLDIASYIDCVAAEVELFAHSHDGKFPKISTMFWGGGTPSILPEHETARLAEVFSKFGTPAEWTVEAAPTGLTDSKLRLFKNLGVNRISLGIQSFNEKTLAALGRAHTLKNSLAAIEKIASADFEKFSIDLIFGAKGQSIPEWEADIDEAARQPVNHISAYCLESESATSACSGRLENYDYLSREREGDFFETAMLRLPERGFLQYEISNYAAAGFECRHNTAIWNMAQWIGFGPAAASQFDGIRRRNPMSLEKWADGIRRGYPIYEDVVKLDDEEMFCSAVIFGLRMSAGVDLETLGKRFPKARAKKYFDTAKNLHAENLIEIDGGKIRLTNRGKMLADSVAVEFLQ